MVFGACATHFINVFSTIQCALYIVTGAHTNFGIHTHDFFSSVVQRVTVARQCVEVTH